MGTVPEKPALRLQHQLSAVTAAVAGYRNGLTATAGQLAGWFDASDSDVRELALDFAHRHFPGLQKLEWAEGILRGAVPGRSLATRVAQRTDRFIPGLKRSRAARAGLWRDAVQIPPLDWLSRRRKQPGTEAMDFGAFRR